MRNRPPSPRRGLKRVTAACLAGVAAVAVSAIGVSSAQAAPVPISATFDDAALNLPDPIGTSDILDPPNVATMTGTVDSVTGALNVPAANFEFPTFTGSAGGFPVAVDFAAVDDINGTANPATGDVTTTASTYHTTVVVVPGPSPLDTCEYDSEESFSTGAGSPFNGDPFTVNIGNPITVTNGIIQTGWGASHFTQTAGGDICNGTLTPLINGGSGGLELGNGFDLTPEAVTPPPAGGTTTPPPTSNKAALKKCIKKAKKKFKNNPAKKKKAIKKCKKKFG